MIRTALLAASAIALFASASANAGEVRVKTSGKAPAELRADIAKAASQACADEVRGTALAGYTYTACVRDAVDRAAAQANGPQKVASSAL
ncbi:hypothetical protein [Caulobacter soli]|uniref:hypothetical protein n=1 Tax=Caulobacter soli TaxID=2708539 RepID=UPI0013EBD933|nr:hypothetical protein [Caulobacter soli]